MLPLRFEPGWGEREGQETAPPSFGTFALLHGNKRHPVWANHSGHYVVNDSNVEIETPHRIRFGRVRRERELRTGEYELSRSIDLLRGSARYDRGTREKDCCIALWPLATETFFAQRSCKAYRRGCFLAGSGQETNRTEIPARTRLFCSLFVTNDEAEFIAVRLVIRFNHLLPSFSKTALTLRKELSWRTKPCLPAQNYQP